MYQNISSKILFINKNKFFIFTVIIQVYSWTTLASAEQNLAHNEPKTCFNAGCNRTAASILDHMNKDVDPCDDFYKFTCGKFLDNTIIPEDQTMVDSFTQIEDTLRFQLKRQIEGSNLNDSKSFKRVKTLYQSCMNKTRIKERGLEPLHQILQKLGGWPVLQGEKWNRSGFNWRESVYKFRKAGFSVSFFIAFDIISDLKNRNTIVLDQPELGLNRAYLSKGRGEKNVEEYYNYMVDVAEILGANRTRASKELEKSLEFEIKLANISLAQEERRNITALFNLTTVADLSKKFSFIPWLEYINTILGLSPNITQNEPVIISDWKFIFELKNLLNSTSKRTKANYIMWRAIKDSIRNLNDQVRDRELQYLAVTEGKSQREPRWQECVDYVSKVYSKSVDASYVRENFKEDAKRNASQMVSDIKQEFRGILKNATWMDEQTRGAALEKIDSMIIHIGYPDEILNITKVDEYYESLEINPAYYYESALNISIFLKKNSFAKLRKAANRSEWAPFVRSAEVNAYNSILTNSIYFPAGILQGTFFDNDRPRYMNYGSIGFIIGHEITHGFDDMGSQLDKNGNVVDWWQQRTKEKYQNLTKCILYQYGNYTVREVNLKLNGIITMGENIADNGGAKEAYRAYNNWARNQREPEPRLPGLEEYSPQQMFWISSGNAWCVKYQNEILKVGVETNSHSPGEFRVLGSLSNMPQFATDFKCKNGSRMNPVNKCTVW